MIRRADDDATFWQRLEEADQFFMGRGKVPQTVKALAADLDREGISDALIGAMALNAHGFRRETVDVDVLIRPEGLAAFKEKCLGRRYCRAVCGRPQVFQEHGDRCGR